MNFVKLFSTITGTVLLLVIAVQQAFAVSLPNFGSCLNPKVAASQVNNGNDHGVVGADQPYVGVDSIYRLSDGNVLQCLCQVNGDGIQTMWFKAPSLSQDDIDSLQSDGWIYVPTGASWGLSDDPYFAKNSNYSCKGSVNNTSISSNNDTKNTIVGSVLGLASTGISVVILGFFLIGISSLTVGLLLARLKRNN